MAIGFPVKDDYVTGDVLTAANMNDLSGTLNTLSGTQEAAGYAAGKNKIINGDCNVNQRAFSSSTTSTSYIVDRFQFEYTGGTTTGSVQAFTAGPLLIKLRHYRFGLKHQAELLKSVDMLIRYLAQVDQQQLQRLEHCRQYLHRGLDIQ
jgi:hypothetical protein